MGTRSFADVAPTAGTIALNAYIYGYGGHSLVTPHTTLKQLWWTDERIDAKVTRSFIVTKLRGEERNFLHKPLAFGEGLTDDTYMEWILDRARRLFLILADIGVPDQIFGCIDDSWDDDDLPISRDMVRTLDLAYDNDETLNRKFYDTQFVYLLREIKHGAHVDYSPKEHIPMDYANTVPPAVALQSWDRVHFPGRPDNIFMRRKVSLTDKDHDTDHRDSFLRDVKQAQGLSHEHIAQAWGSYTAKDSAYVLSDFVGEHTLATFMNHRVPPQLARIAVADRPALIGEWMHCLADAIAFLHDRGIAHTAIRPSNIIIDEENHIAFSDVGCIRTFQRGKKVNKSESYDYAAPESQIVQAPLSAISSPAQSNSSTFSRAFRSSASTSGSSCASSSSGSQNSTIGGACLTPITSNTSKASSRANSVVTVTGTISPEAPPTKAERAFRNFSRRIVTTEDQSCPAPIVPFAAGRPATTESLFAPVRLDPRTLADLPSATPLQSDMFSLGCIFLDVVTFLVKGRISDFVKFRTTKVKPLRLPGASKTSTSSRYDTSFHYDPDKISRWMALLEAEALVKSNEHPFYHGVPALLTLIRGMLAQNATLRPTAMHVRDVLLDILVRDSSVDRPLCCSDREWDGPNPDPHHSVSSQPGIAVTTSISPSRYPARFFDRSSDSDSSNAPFELMSFTDQPRQRPRTASAASVAKSSKWHRFGPGRKSRDSQLSTTPSTATVTPGQDTPEEIDLAVGQIEAMSLAGKTSYRGRRGSVTSVATTNTAVERRRNAWLRPFSRAQG